MDYSDDVHDVLRVLDELLNREREMDRHYNDDTRIIMEGVGGNFRGGGNVNFYPSEYRGACHQKAFFVSLTGHRWNVPRKGKGKLTFEQMFEKIIQHFTGNCEGTTQKAFIITDSWNDDVCMKWISTINNLKSKKITFNTFIITGKTISVGEL